MFYHSLLSDWNHGNAHFLRGVVSELISRGHDVRVFEPHDSWSLSNLKKEHGDFPILRFRDVYRGIESARYDIDRLVLDEVLGGADLVIVHEWNDHKLVKMIDSHRSTVGGYRLLFHDTHHRSVTQQESMAAYDLSHYDGVLAYGNVIRDIYLKRGWAEKAWTWHEAADTRVFFPREENSSDGDLVWIGNWGDEERTAELREFFIEPVKALGLKARAYGVRYPEEACRSLAEAGIEYAGWLPNYEVPEVFAHYKVTVHIPRRPYVMALPGIPTIRPFEALACGIPLISSPWEDMEGLFTQGKDFLVARDGKEMRMRLNDVIHDDQLARELALHGRQTILNRHTCSHRVDELFAICQELGMNTDSVTPTHLQGGKR
jgi:spore maturation protein CgeB